MITLKKTKSLIRIKNEWNTIAAIREDQVSTGKDHSANFVLAPAILNEISSVNSLIDIGCGTGWLTERASKYAETVVGIDPSEESIAIGRQLHSSDRIIYYSESIESYAVKGQLFDVAISNMAASSSPDLYGFLAASRSILKKNAFFIFTIPHPFFWPSYWGYASDPNFDYQESYAVEGEFKIQTEKSTILTTHFHHPLEQYIKVLCKNRFQLHSIRELKGLGFNLPRFMLIKVRAI
ncbi:MAG: methyltransferase domain-containing protein [Glaciimonas sp.]|nr:methyltransferase domain-containing protein [Glaciimonas sp.]